MSRLRFLSLVFASAALLSGCPRMANPAPDAGVYDPVLGNPFEGPISLDEARMNALDPSTLPAGPTPCREPVLARVYSVSDGDTFHVRGNDPVIDVRVRLIGVDTPEVTTNECYSEEASLFTQQLDGQLVWLTFDNDCFDDFSRLLAYVYVGGGEGDMWQRQLLRRGLATVLTIGGNRSQSATFVADEREAESASIGLWDRCR